MSKRSRSPKKSSPKASPPRPQDTSKTHCFDFISFDEAAITDYLKLDLNNIVFTVLKSNGSEESICTSNNKLLKELDINDNATNVYFECLEPKYNPDGTIKISGPYLTVHFLSVKIFVLHEHLRKLYTTALAGPDRQQRLWFHNSENRIKKSMSYDVLRGIMSQHANNSAVSGWHCDEHTYFTVAHVSENPDKDPSSFLLFEEDFDEPRSLEDDINRLQTEEDYCRKYLAKNLASYNKDVFNNPIDPARGVSIRIKLEVPEALQIDDIQRAKEIEALIHQIKNYLPFFVLENEVNVMKHALELFFIVHDKASLDTYIDSLLQSSDDDIMNSKTASTAMVQDLQKKIPVLVGFAFQITRIEIRNMRISKIIFR
jgi:hypothetical protein